MAVRGAAWTGGVRGHPRPDGLARGLLDGLDLGPDGRAARVVGDVQDGAADAGEAALDGGDHHVADAELDQAVGWVDLPGGAGLGGWGGGAHAGGLSATNLVECSTAVSLAQYY